MKLWLVRHATPLIAAGTCYGASDIPADAAATEAQARDLAAVLPQGLPVICSTLGRCGQLSRALLALRPDLSVRTDARIAEMDFGAWEGRLWEDIPEPEYSAWIDDFAGYVVGGGESVRGFMARVEAALADSRRHAEAVWITHGGVIRAVSLLVQGVREVHKAGQWPREAPGHGTWREIMFN
ncbi:MAG: histidine phosphatase family protein [Burkholderiaceae bacterium]|nr:histidine phosphatase family protein [Burkholderiaceae bacterium]